MIFEPASLARMERIQSQCRLTGEFVLAAVRCGDRAGGSVDPVVTGCKEYEIAPLCWHSCDE
jgi:hypothetical protein